MSHRILKRFGCSFNLPIRDILAIIDNQGTVVVEYEYSAWGVILSVTGTLATTLGKINPFRYRSYYYDEETGFYYLQSRYYDPEICRFINADDPITLFVEPNSLIRYNLFAYCNNSPVNYSDHTGHFGTPIQWVCAIIGGIVGWYFGDYVANKLGFYDGAWWKPNTWAYWVVRGLVVAGGAILGYVAAGALTKILTSYLYANPAVLAKMPFWIKWFLGMTGGTIVIGETMARVIEYAKQIGASVYNGFKYYDKVKALFGENIANILGKADNAIWLINKMMQQYKIIDIGIDVTRASRSSSYILEQIIIWLTKYKDVVKEFFK